jgi:hypothetical protein
MLIGEEVHLLRGAGKLERSRGAHGVGFDVVRQEVATAHDLSPRYSIQVFSTIGIVS